jgi:hypothetical protein
MPKARRQSRSELIPACHLHKVSRTICDEVKKAMQFSIRIREGDLSTPAFVLTDDQKLSTAEGRASAIEAVVKQAKKHFEREREKRASVVLRRNQKPQPDVIWPPPGVSR